MNQPSEFRTTGIAWRFTLFIDIGPPWYRESGNVPVTGQRNTTQAWSESQCRALHAVAPVLTSFYILLPVTQRLPDRSPLRMIEYEIG
jgi:hypothetical protein